MNNISHHIFENLSAGENSKNEEGVKTFKVKRKRRECKATTYDTITKSGSVYCIINSYLLDENQLFWNTMIGCRLGLFIVILVLIEDLGLDT